MRVTLVGFMGCGKSTVAALLARRLGWRLVEMDELILSNSGEESIEDIFQKRGEGYFRDLECACLNSLSKEDKLVVSAGGGVVMRPENLDALKAGGGKVVYLETGFEEVKKRLGDGRGRPLFQDVKQAENLYIFRVPLYKRFCDVKVKSEDKTPEQVAQEIQVWLAQAGK
ncbi:MAG: shikimate kinase [Deltaproteobacteria bacterium]|nr:shikimate kinase [Deltaproteobacteria bacterium]